MTHEAIQERLSDYWDGELSPMETRATADHLRGCAACREELELYRKADAAALRVANAAAPAETEAFARAVLRRLEPAPELAFLSTFLASPSRSIPAFALAAAALMLLALPARVKTYDPTEALLMRQDAGRTYAWLREPADTAAAVALAWAAR